MQIKGDDSLKKDFTKSIMIYAGYMADWASVIMITIMVVLFSVQIMRQA